MQLRVNFIEH